MSEAKLEHRNARLMMVPGLKKAPEPLIIRLISMPFGPLHYPSIGLTQIRSVIKERFGNRVQVHLHYLNHDFGQFLGTDLYNVFCHSAEADDHQDGDWLFRRSAFPEAADNTDLFFSSIPGEEGKELREAYDTQLKPYHDDIPVVLEQLIQQYNLTESHIIGFSSMFAQNLASIAMARAIRRHNPDIFQIIGGANCEFPMGLEFVHHLDCFDAAASGSGLMSFPDLIQQIMTGKWDQIHRINGIFTTKNSISACNFPIGSPQRNSPDALLKHGIKPSGDERALDQVTKLDYDSFLNNYERLFADKLGKPFVTFETSRGCWWGERNQCTFCGLNGNSIEYRYMSDHVVLEYIQDLMQRYGQRVSHFECIDNIMPRHYPKDVLPRLHVPDDVRFYWEVRADLDNKDLKELASAHVMEIQPGIEALNTKSLRLMRKGTTAFTNIELLRNASLYSIRVLWYLMLGFPGEQTEVYRKYINDFPRLLHLMPPISIMEVEYHRYSSYFNQQEQFGIKLEPADFYYLHFPFSADVIAGFAYYFQDVRTERHEDPECGTCKQQLRPDVPPELYEQMENCLSYWQKRFNGDDGLPKARLYYHSGKASCRTVIDTRDGNRKEYRLTRLEHEIARFLDKSGRLARIYREFSDYGQPEINQAMSELYHRYKLVFRERDTYISLIPGPP